MTGITNVVRNIPKAVVHGVRQKLLGGSLRGRGPRVHDGRRYFQDLPRALSSRFSLYQNGYNYPKQFFDYAGCDKQGRVHLKYNQSEDRGL